MSDAGERQIPSPFADILERLVTTSPGALGAAFVDEEGEAVDIYGEIDPFDLKVAGAHMGIIASRLGELSEVCRCGRFLELRLLAQRRQYITRPVSIGYQITVVLEPVACLPKLARAFERAMAEIRVEAGGVLG